MPNKTMLGLAAMGGRRRGNVTLPAGQTVRIRLEGPVTVAYHPRAERSNAD